MTSGLTPTASPPGRGVNLGVATALAFGVVNLLLLAACVVAVWQNLKLRTALAYDVALLTPRTGGIVPPLIGEDWLGTPQSIAYGLDHRPTLVYSFTKECGYCQRNWRAIRAFQVLAPRDLRIAYLDTQGDTFTPEYLAANGIKNSVLLVQLSPQAEYTYNARAVPQLILVSGDGHVQWSHVGGVASGDVSKALSIIEHDLGGKT